MTRFHPRSGGPSVATRARLFLTSAAHLGLLSLPFSGCYGGALNPSLNEIYVCEEDDECAVGSRCLSNVCTVSAEDQDPALQLLSPAPLEVFSTEQGGALPIAVAGARLLLTSQPDGDTNAGYIEISIDGALTDTITAGDLETGIEVGTVAMPSTPGLHHITLVARRVNGELFEGSRAQTTTGFWVDDGREHIGILSPPPGEKVPLGDGENLSVEIVSLNFTMVNPGFVAPTEVSEPGLGYVHLYLDATLPGCLPSCNFEHQSAIIPAGLSRVNQITAEQAVLLPSELGTVQVQVVAQTLANTPYLRDTVEGDFVFHSVPVQSTVEVSP